MVTLRLQLPTNPCCAPYCMGLLWPALGTGLYMAVLASGHCFLLSLLAIKASVPTESTVLSLDLLGLYVKCSMEALTVDMWLSSQWCCFGRWVLARGSESFCFSVPQEVKELLFHLLWPQRCSGNNHRLEPSETTSQNKPLSFCSSPESLTAIRKLTQCDDYESTVLKSPGFHLDMSVRAFLGRFN